MQLPQPVAPQPLAQSPSSDAPTRAERDNALREYEAGATVDLAANPSSNQDEQSATSEIPFQMPNAGVVLGT